jgi:hypothetical protein
MPIKYSLCSLFVKLKVVGSVTTKLLLYILLIFWLCMNSFVVFLQLFGCKDLRFFGIIQYIIMTLIDNGENCTGKAKCILTKNYLVCWMHNQISLRRTYRVKKRCEGNFRYLLAYWSTVLNQALWKCCLIVVLKNVLDCGKSFVLQKDNMSHLFKLNAWNFF